MHTAAGAGRSAPGGPARGGSPPRPARARGCSRRGAPRLRRCSQPLAHARGEDIELVAVFGDGAPGDLDAPFRELLDDLLVGERILGIFVRDQLLDLGLDGARARVLAGRRREAAREKELERQEAARRLDVFLVRHAAHGTFVHVDDVGDLAQGQRLQELDPLLEELALPVHDEVHHLEHRLAALLDGLDHPLGAVEALVDELLVLALELFLVARDVQVRLGEPQARQPLVVEEHVVAVVDLLDDEVGADVLVVRGGVLQAGFGVELPDFVGGLLHLLGLEAEAFPQLAPAVGLEVVPGLLDQPIRQRVLAFLLFQLQQQALAQVPRAHPWWVERLADAQYRFGVLEGVLGDLHVPFDLVRMFVEDLIDAADDLLERRLEIAVFPDVAEELLVEKVLARRQVEHLDLLAQVVVEVFGLDRDRLDVLGRFAQVAHAGRRRVGAVVEQDLLPIRLVVSGLLLLRLDLLDGGRFLLPLGLDELEERVAEQLLLQVLLQVQERHVQQVHGLIEPRVDPQLLFQDLVLVQSRFHAAGERRARSRAVSVGPKYRSATRSSNTRSRTVPDTWTLPSNMMYARSTMSRVCSTLWSVISTPMPLCRRPATIVWMSCTAMGSTPANGSSRSRNFGVVTSARVISSRRRSPPDSWSAFCRRRCLMPSSSRRPSRRWRSSAGGSSRVSRMASTFSSTLSFRNTDGSCAR